MDKYSRVFVIMLLVLWGGSARAQLGQLLSPGPLSKPHARLEGSANCSQCHEAGKQVSAARCLQCH
ncbi:MAG: cytochrome C, partial [Thermoanaerobaculia bacterium]